MRIFVAISSMAPNTQLARYVDGKHDCTVAANFDGFSSEQTRACVEEFRKQGAAIVDAPEPEAA